jgi:hypothetical protein
MSESLELLKANLQDCRKENAKLHDEKMALLKTVGDLQHDLRQASFQNRIRPWMIECFGPSVLYNQIERNWRFIEEALELAQTCGATKEQVLELVEYTFSREPGEIVREVGGVMTTLAALCIAMNVDMHSCAEAELRYVWDNIEKIRAKWESKTLRTPVP